MSVRFPDDVATGDMSDYVVFDFFDYQPPFRGNETFGAELNNKLLEPFDLAVVGGGAAAVSYTHLTLPTSDLV